MVSLADLELLKAEGLEQRYRIKLRVQNPDRKPLNLEGISFRFYLNGERFADGVSPSSVSIAPFSDALVSVDVTSNLYRIFRQIQKLVDEKDEEAPMTWRIKGGLALSDRLIRVPFDAEGELNVVPDKDEKPKK